MAASGDEAPFNPTLVLFQPSPSPASIAHTVLSIPLWSYFNSPQIASLSPPLSLSIPLWSYFNTALSMRLFASSNFQSHFGLISTQLYKLTARRARLLSIPLWSYFNDATAIQPSPFASLSIPLWSYFNTTLLSLQQ